MQIISRVLLLALVGIASGKPAPLSLFESTEVLGQEDHEVQPNEVIFRMEQDLGELNWVSIPHGGRLLTVPRYQWYEYIAIVEKERQIKRSQKRQVDPGFTRLPAGIDGRWAEYHCNPMGYPEGIQPRPDATNACSSWSYTTGSQPIQVYLGRPAYNPDGQMVLNYYTYENWGGLNYAWDRAKCEEAFRRIDVRCPAGMRGGTLNIYTAPQQNTQTRLSKALAFKVTPGAVLDSWTRVPGGIDGRWAEYRCNSGPSWGDRVVSHTWACHTWSYTTGSQPLQMNEEQGFSVNTSRQLVRYMYTYENWGGLSYAWNVAKCAEVMDKIEFLCSVYDAKGKVNIYTAPQNSPTKGSKALAFTIMINITGTQNGKN